jgi:hypothetical protein
MFGLTARAFCFKLTFFKVDGMNSPTNLCEAGASICNVAAFDGADACDVYGPFESREVAIGDLGGDWNKFLALTLESGFVQQEAGQSQHSSIEHGRQGQDLPGRGRLKWTGGNNKLVFAGDILADRHPNGFSIILEMLSLKRQAQAAGGDVVWILGNHDYEMIQMLLKGEPTDFTGTRAHKTHAGGILEAVALLVDDTTRQRLFYKTRGRHVFPDGYENRGREILEVLKQSDDGKELLTAMKQFELFHRSGDVLYVHTDPVSRVLANLKDQTYQDIKDNLPDLFSYLVREYDSDTASTLVEKLAKWFVYEYRHARLALEHRAGLHSSRYGLPVDASDADRNQDKFVRECLENLEHLYDDGVRTICFGHSKAPFACFGVLGDHMYVSVGHEDDAFPERFSSRPFKDPSKKCIHFIALDRNQRLDGTHRAIEVVKPGEPVDCAVDNALAAA